MKESGVLNELKVVWRAELFVLFMVYFRHFGLPLVAQTVKCLPAMQETRV